MMRFSSVLVVSAVLGFGCSDDGDTDDDNDTDGPGDTDIDTDTDVDTDITGGTVGIECGTDGVGILQGTITDDLTLGTECNWLISGGVFIGNDVDETVLTILPGAQLYGEGSLVSFLAIRRGSKIMAEGTAADPIVFQSDATGGPGRGQWGGLILNGKAPINAAGGESEGEGGTGLYGGNVPTDNSGVLKYVRVQYGGIPILEDVEINGIAFAGVGSGTEVDYVQVHANADDGFEFFGGTVNAKHLVVSCGDDDGIDWDLGYAGSIQFALVTQGCDDAGNNGIEADNQEADHDATPRSHPTLSNVTLVGNGDGMNSPNGILLRRGTDATIANVVVSNWATSCLAIDDDATFAAAPDIDHTMLDCETLYDDDEDNEETVFEGGTGNTTGVDPQLIDTSLAAGNPNFAPASGSPAATGGAVPSGSFFEPATYLGAFDPAGTDWTDGWTNWDL